MRARLSALALAGSMLLGGCTDILNALGTVEGDYVLESFNGTRPPVVLTQTATGREELIDSSLQLYADGEYVVTFVYRVSTSGGSRTENQEVRGTYSRSGSELRFRDPETGAVTYASYDGRQLELDAEGDSYVYQRY